MPIVSDSFNLEPYTVSYSCFFLFYLLNAWNTLALDVPFNSKLHQTLITFWIFKLFLHIRANVKQEGQRQTTNIIKMTVWPESQEFKRIDYGFKLKCTNESSSRISYRGALRICRVLSSQYELGRFTHLCSSAYNPWSTLFLIKILCRKLWIGFIPYHLYRIWYLMWSQQNKLKRWQIWNLERKLDLIDNCSQNKWFGKGTIFGHRKNQTLLDVFVLDDDFLERCFCHRKRSSAS